MNQELEQLHRDASTHYLKGEYAEAVRCWQRVLSKNADDERAREGIRLCEQMDAAEEEPPAGSDPGETLPVEPALAESEAEEAFAFDFSAPGEGDPAPPPDAAAASELQRRVETLLDEARGKIDSGDNLAARKILDRVLILDEVNESAQRLQGALEANPPDGGYEPVLELSLDTDGTTATAPALEPGAMPETSEAQEAAEPFQITGNEVVPDEPVEAAASEPPPEKQSELPAAHPPRPTPAPAPRGQALPHWASDRRVQLGAGGALLLVAVFVGLLLTGGEESPMEPLNAVANGRKPPVAENPAAAVPAALPDPGPAPVDLDALMAEAEAAFQSGDYGEAVIAYDKVLAEEPGHEDANARLKRAAELFKQSNEKQQRWDDAIASFEEGQYAESLRLLYRMADGDYEADLDRMRLNGWYNLGVSALKSRDCPRAEESFTEALGIDGSDPGSIEGFELAESCRGAAVTKRIASLGYRQATD